jgi:lipopolysaccharide/colanic/teichoic acid biosynthesis glycosyltransferase
MAHDGTNNGHLEHSLMQSNVELVHQRALAGAAVAPAVAYPRDIAVIRPWEQSDPRAERLRRALNVVVAAIALVLLSPIMLLIALAVKLTSPGPVLYTQLRVGLDRRSTNGGNWRRKVDYGGKLFRIYKFRTMYVQQKQEEVWAKEHDPRVTPIGRILRKYRLDELPQLANVVKGDMNIVGPRPEQPTIFMSLRDSITQYPARQGVLPGITGLAQVSQPYDRDVEDVRRKVQYDLEYAARVSAMEDLRIMLRTLPVMLTGKGSL